MNDNKMPIKGLFFFLDTVIICNIKFLSDLFKVPLQNSLQLKNSSRLIIQISSVYFCRLV